MRIYIVSTILGDVVARPARDLLPAARHDHRKVVFGGSHFLAVMPFGNSTERMRLAEGLNHQPVCNPKGIVSSSPATVFSVQERSLDF